MSELGGRKRGTEDSREGGEEGRMHTKWEILVELIYAEILVGELAEEAACRAVVLTSKLGG